MATAKVPQTARERGRIAPAKFAHAVIRSGRGEELIAWYKTVLQAEVMFASPFITFLTYDEEHHRIAIANIPGLTPAPAGSTGLEHLAFTYASLDDLLATYERLKTEGIVPYWCINHGPTLSLYYRDPENNQIELQIDIFEDAQGVNDWMERSDFDVNFIGVRFDPEDLIRRYRAGEPASTLLERPVIDPSEVFTQMPEPPA